MKLYSAARISASAIEQMEYSEDLFRATVQVCMMAFRNLTDAGAENICLSTLSLEAQEAGDFIATFVGDVQEVG